jgi:cytochrome c biogenesis protein CcmG/thiol:disulfide interchange protein DsbE
MWRFLIPIGLFGALVWFFNAGLDLDPRKIPSPLIGKPAPEFTLPVLGEPARQVSMSDYRGQVVLVNVWGSWCVACRAEHQTLLAIARSGEVPILGLDWKDETADAQAWLRNLGNPYDITLVDMDGRVAIDFGVYGAPESFLIDKQGTIIHKITGPIDWQMWNEEILPIVRQAKEAS